MGQVSQREQLEPFPILDPAALKEYVANLPRSPRVWKPSLNRYLNKKDQALVGSLSEDGHPESEVVQTSAEDVTLHIYDANWLLARTRFDAVHLGVEIFGSEFSFGDLGVRRFEPGTYDKQRHRLSIVIATTMISKPAVVSLLLRLKDEWPGSRYRLIGCNCQTFAMALCEGLGIGGCIPNQYLFFAKSLQVSNGVDINDYVPDFLLNHFGSASGASGSGSGSISSISTASGSGSCGSCDMTSGLASRESVATSSKQAADKENVYAPGGTETDIIIPNVMIGLNNPKNLLILSDLQHESTRESLFALGSTE